MDVALRKPVSCRLSANGPPEIKTPKLISATYLAVLNRPVRAERGTILQRQRVRLLAGGGRAHVWERRERTTEEEGLSVAACGSITSSRRSRNANYLVHKDFGVTAAAEFRVCE